jgi:protein SCO1/2
MNSRRLWLVIGAVALIGVLGWAFGAMRPPAVPQGNLAGASIGGPFMLIDQDGKPASDLDFAGRYRLMYFGYTFCPDVCPTDVAILTRGVAGFAGAHPALAQKLAPIFVTVDPARDDPAAMKAFVRAFSPTMVGLTGSPAAIAAMLNDYGIYARKAPGSDAADYLVDHLAVIYLFGPDGKPIGFLPHGSTAAEITAMLEAHVR